MPKPGQLVRYMKPDGKEVLGQIVALSKDCTTQVDDKCPTCGSPQPRKLVPTHTTAKGELLDDENMVELVELEMTFTTDEKGNPVPLRSIVGGRQCVSRALTRDERKPNTWWTEEV